MAKARFSSSVKFGKSTGVAQGARDSLASFESMFGIKMSALEEGISAWFQPADIALLDETQIPKDSTLATLLELFRFRNAKGNMLLTRIQALSRVVKSANVANRDLRMKHNIPYERAFALTLVCSAKQLKDPDLLASNSEEIIGLIQKRPQMVVKMFKGIVGLSDSDDF